MNETARQKSRDESSAVFLDTVEKFIHTLSVADQAKIAAHAVVMRSGDFKSVRIKQLKGPIAELIVKQYRLIFFKNKKVIYFVGAFIKKSTKTPLREIRHAEEIYKSICNIF